MKKRLLILILIIMFVISTITFVLILKYLDPYENKIMAVSFLTLSFMLSVTSFFSVVLYFVKKIYFRWEVFLSNVLISFRQAFFFASFFLGLAIFLNIWTPILRSGSLLFVMLVFIELLIKNLER